MTTLPPNCRVVETPLGNTFICSRGADIPRCRCGYKATHRCDFALRGRKAGEVCGASLCKRCRHQTPIGDMCRVHAELDARERQKIRGEPVNNHLLDLLRVTGET